MEVQINDLNQDDLVECAALYVSVFKESPWNETWSTEDAFEHLSDFLACPNTIALKGTKNNRILGFLIGETQKWNNLCSYYLKEICVGGKDQRNGVGALIMPWSIVAKPPQASGRGALPVEVVVEPAKPAKACVQALAQ
ncbi:hypothetical protein, partial [Rhabdochromatium marinum]|uniref:hypothetical protein n=1 Tax=Rhabdochromatium marinum TaxID=48729 RepID=UPI0019083922